MTARTLGGRPPAPPSLTAALLAVLPVQAEEMNDRDRFDLWNECKPVALTVKYLPDKSTEIAPTQDGIETTARSRLRTARLHDPTDTARLSSILRFARSIWHTLSELVFCDLLSQPIS